MMGRVSSVREWTAGVKRERGWLCSELTKLGGVRVADSKANFLLASMPVGSARAHAELLRRGIATREVGDVPGMRNCLRITVGTRSMNRLLLKALKEILRVAA
jgi:histidinol-phosphate aminotransferase